MNGPIYEPKGAAKEYGDLAVNIYTGCPHRCWYCYAPGVLHKVKEEFHANVEPRANIVGKVRAQVEREGITGKLIFLCFTCDPYPTGYDSSATREIIKILKDSGNHVQILTKGDGSRDFDLLDGEDWYGITISGKAESKDTEPGAIQAHERLAILKMAKLHGIKTWVSFEPVVNAVSVLRCLNAFSTSFDLVKIGKLNYHPSYINWKEFGKEAEALCKKLGVDYYIKDSLRKEMDKD